VTPVLPTIVHLDADAFFVSVEQALDPALRGKKVAVGGRQRGIISSASYEARACGVYTPMPTTRALQVCPDLILVDHAAGRYGEYSRRLFNLCEELTPVVERRSVDEGFLDVSHCGFRTTEEIETVVRGLQDRIWQKLLITVSFGLAANKLVAAIASKLHKPRGFVVVPPGTEAAFLAPLEVGRLPGIGAKTEAMLRVKGIRRIRDLLARAEVELHALFGDDWRRVVAAARGEDRSAVETIEEDAKSYSQQETFPRDIGEFVALECIAKRMIDELMPKIRADKKRVRTITVKVRYPGMENATAGQSLEAATDLEAAFYGLVRPLLQRVWPRRRPVRLLGVRLSGVEDGPAQMEMFAEGEEKRRRLAGVMDQLNQQGHRTSVRRGHQLDSPADF
jgi:DNA polymerase-4